MKEQQIRGSFTIMFRIIHKHVTKQTAASKYSLHLIFRSATNGYKQIVIFTVATNHIAHNVRDVNLRYNYK